MGRTTATTTALRFCWQGLVCVRARRRRGQGDGVSWSASPARVRPRLQLRRQARRPLATDVDLPCPPSSQPHASPSQRGLMSYGSPDPYGGGSPAPSPAAFDAPSPAVSINSATGRPLKGKGSRGPYKKRKRDGQGPAGGTGGSSAASAGGGQHLYDDFADGPSDGGRGDLPTPARRDSNAPPWSFGPPGGRSARASTPAAGPSRRGTAGPSTPAPTPGPSGGLRDDDEEDEDVVDDEDELARLDGGDGEGGEGEQQGEVRRRIQRVKEDQMWVFSSRPADEWAGRLGAAGPVRSCSRRPPRLATCLRQS